MTSSNGEVHGLDCSNAMNLNCTILDCTVNADVGQDFLDENRCGSAFHANGGGWHDTLHTPLVARKVTTATCRHAMECMGDFVTAEFINTDNRAHLISLR